MTLRMDDKGNISKINRILSDCPVGVPMTSAWLKIQGVSPQLAKRYENSRWLDSLGRGAWKRSGSELTLSGALFALQSQLGLQAYAAARSALGMQGRAHYLAVASHPILELSLPSNQSLPAWFIKQPFARNLRIINSTSLFTPVYVGLSPWQDQSVSIKISSPERAMLEVCSLLPGKVDAEETMQLMEGLISLRPKLMQNLLEACRSIKTKRLFLALASLVRHPWYEELNVDLLELGTGNRSLVPGGWLHPEFRVTIPHEWLPA